VSEKGQGEEGVVSGLGVTEPIPGDEVRVDPGLGLDATGDEVVVEVRSDFTLDSNSQTVDANARGISSD
jgi:hypothetical protein